MQYLPMAALRGDTLLLSGGRGFEPRPAHQLPFIHHYDAALEHHFGVEHVPGYRASTGIGWKTSSDLVAS